MKTFTSREIKPTGWLRKQLTIQAEGLSGNLHKMWGDIKESAWIGGDKEGWERVPYWLDGFIPLAYLLENEELIATAKKYIDAIIDRQQPDGWICPCSDEERETYDTWTVLLISKVLVVYAECSGEAERIEGVLKKTLWQFYKHLSHIELKEWGRTRWYEGLIAVKWLYDRTGEEWLRKLAYKLKIQGIDWKTVYEQDMQAEYRENWKNVTDIDWKLALGKLAWLSEKNEEWNQFTHVVNAAMGIKAYALMSDFSGEDANEFAEKTFSYLTEHYGTAYGHFNGDECLAPSSPIRGSELCGVVEAMYSYETVFAKTENPVWLDRLEKLAYNGLPATLSPDMWTHQYLQQVNQVQCAPMKKTLFGSNNEEAHIFGLEPNFGCCTANFSQGFPKFALSTYFRTENGIMATGLAPAKLTATVNGSKVLVDTITEYPFRNTVTYEITTDKPTEFEFSFRVPACVKSAKYNGETAKAGEIVRINKLWDNEKIEVTYELEAKLIKRPNGMVCLWYGPLLYSVPIESDWQMREYEEWGVERKYPYCDWHIYPKSSWNYGFAGDEFEVKIHDYDRPFDYAKPPVSITASMRKVKWDMNENGYCEELPDLSEVSENVERIELVPYGATVLRMTEMPKI